MGKINKLKNLRIVKSTIIDFIITYGVFVILYIMSTNMSIHLNAMNLGLFFIALLMFTCFKNLITTSFYLNKSETKKVYKPAYFIYLFIIVIGLIISLLILYYGMQKEYLVGLDNLDYEMLKYNSVSTVGLISLSVASIFLIITNIFAKNVAISYLKREKDEFSTFYYFSATFLIIEAIIVCLNYIIIFNILQTISVYNISSNEFFFLFTGIIIYLAIIKCLVFYLNDTYYNNASNVNEFSFDEQPNNNRFDVYIISMVILIVSMQLFFVQDVVQENDNNYLKYSSAEAYYNELYNELAKAEEDTINYIYVSDLVYSIYQTDNNEEVIKLIDSSLSSKSNFDNSDHMNLVASIKESLLLEEVNGDLQIREEGEFLGSPVLSITDNNDDLVVFSTIGSLSNPDGISYTENEIITAIESTFKGNIVEDLTKKSSGNYDATIIINENSNSGYVTYYNVGGGE